LPCLTAGFSVAGEIGLQPGPLLPAHCELPLHFDGLLPQAHDFCFRIPEFGFRLAFRPHVLIELLLDRLDAPEQSGQLPVLVRGLCGGQDR